MNYKNFDTSFSTTSKLNKLFSFYDQKGYVKLGKIVSDNYVKKLLKVTNDLMMGKRSYPGMFFKLDDPKGNYYNIKHEDIHNEKFSGPSSRYKKINGKMPTQIVFYDEVRRGISIEEVDRNINPKLKPVD